MSAGGVTVRVARWSAIHPWRAIGLWLLLVVVAVGMSVVIPKQQMQSKDTWVGQSGQAAEMIEQAGLGDRPAETVLLTDPDGRLDKAAATTAMTQLRQKLTALDSVQAVGQPVWSGNGKAALLPIELKGTADDAADAIEKVVATTAEVQQSNPDLSIAQAGTASLDAGIWKQVGSDLAKAEKLSLPITFRSVAIALLTTVLNLASVAACFGVLALVFQHSWAEGLLGFTSSGFVVSWIPLFLFVILVGLSMDYHVFVLGRIREGVAEGLTPREAVRKGVTESAGVVTSAAAVMVSVFAVFATLGMLEMKQMGIGLAVAVLIDATLVRIVMLPSVLVLLGRKAWWPNRLHRQQPVDPERELVTV